MKATNQTDAILAQRQTVYKLACVLDKYKIDTPTPPNQHTDLIPYTNVLSY